ncbi:MAG TPA: ABC transporter permease [Thermoanaerobaculia bacterium]|jgi:ABC-2 type transport system permease protein
MSTPSNVAAFPVDPQPVAPPLSEPRPLYWLVRRELWENRSIYLAPLVLTAVFMFGFTIGTVTRPQRLASASGTAVMPWSVLPAMLIAAAFMVGAFYCLDALQSERRDRSILFWKSLPVSDRDTVLSKASIPLLVLPAIVFTITVIVQILMLLLSSAVVLATGSSAAALWAKLPLFRMTIGLVYSLIAVALWHAPVYAWLLLVSGWARRVVVLWAVLPLLAVAAFERMAFGTKYVIAFLGYRITGWWQSGFTFPNKDRISIDPLTHLTPGRYLSTPGLWLGLVCAAVFLAAAVRLRRRQEAF